MTWRANIIYVGNVETIAPSAAKAKQNIRYRLWKEHGWTRYKAMTADFDVKPVKK